MTDAAQNRLAVNEMFAIPYPTAADVRSYMAFLAERHPQLLNALEQTANSLVAQGMGLSKLLDENATETTSPTEHPISLLPPE